jgi:hypothetical protein
VQRRCGDRLTRGQLRCPGFSFHKKM